METTISGKQPDSRGLFREGSVRAISSAPTLLDSGVTVPDTSTTARVGDVFRAVDGPLATLEIPVISASTNSFVIASKVAPGNGNQFYLLRRATLRLDDEGGLQATIDTTGLATSAKQDTGNTSLSSIDTKATAGNASLSSIDGKITTAIAGTAVKSQAATTVKAAAITVGTSAIRLTHDGDAPSATRRLLTANSEQAVTAKFYIGASGVSAANGLLLHGGETFNREFDAGDYYIISDTAAQTVYVLEQE